MRKSRYIAFMVTLAATNFVFSALVGQLGWLSTGIPGSNMVIFGVIFAIFPSITLLIFKEKRWLFFMQSLLVVMLSLPTYVGGIPFDVISRIPVIVAAVQCDILFNSIHGFFEKREKLLWWAILGSIDVTLITQVIGILVWPLVLAPEAITLWINLIPLLFPVIIIETAVGAYLGYRIYKKVQTLDHNK
jgi:hypothetical protein